MQHAKILAPQPEIKPMPPAVEAQSLNHWTIREVPQNGVFEHVVGQNSWALVITLGGGETILMMTDAPQNQTSLDKRK